MMIYDFFQIHVLWNILKISDSDCYDLVLKRDIYQSTTTKDSSNANIDVWKTDITYPLIALIGFTAIVTFIIIVVAVVSNRRKFIN